MKPWPLLIGIVVILAIVCAPALAISKSDLISQYKAGQFWEPTTPTPTPTATVIPTTVPTQVPTGTGTGTIRVSSIPDGASVYLDGEYKGVDFGPVPSNRMGYISLFDSNTYNALSLTGIPAGPHQLKFTKEGYLDYSTIVTVTGGETIYVRPHLVAKPSWNSPAAISTTKWPVPSKEALVDSLFISPFTGDVKKPNIYLYSDRDLTARVQLAPEKAITVSEPVYQPGMGWQAEIRKGSLNGNGDFLFYEAMVPDAGWQKEEGYVIRADYREQDMSSMLGPYGFNEKETVEFIEYWASHLVGDVDYVFFPQETDTVEQVMPLSVNPTPDHVMRIWFYAEPLITAPEPVTHPEKIVREGFYVVEWGVMIEDTGKILG